jgi:hypothetical protein
MKKVLEDELMSLAHRILKLRNRADIHELKEEAAILYEKLSILSFAEKHFEGLKPTIGKHEIEKSIQKDFRLEHTENLSYPDGTEYNDEAIYEHNTEKIKDIVSQMPIETQLVDQMFDEPIESSKTEEPAKEEDKDEDKNIVNLEDFSVHFDNLPDFEPAKHSEEAKDNTPEEPENKKENESDEKKEDKAQSEEDNDVTNLDDNKPQRTKDLFSSNKKSLNDKLNKDLKIGLNDRLSFVKNLFLGDSKDYEDFIKHINALRTIEEVKDFLNVRIQEKYTHWKDKEETANRLLHLIEKKFE